MAAICGIFKRDVIPALEIEDTASANPVPNRGGFGIPSGLQDAHAHGEESANLLLLVDGDLPDDLPGKQCQHDVHGTGIR